MYALSLFYFIPQTINFDHSLEEVEAESEESSYNPDNNEDQENISSLISEREAEDLKKDHPIAIAMVKDLSVNRLKHMSVKNKELSTDFKCSFMQYSYNEKGHNFYSN